jgi:hypothetical protein
MSTAFGDLENKKLTGATTDRLGKTRPRSRHRVNAFKKTIDFDTEWKTHRLPGGTCLSLKDFLKMHLHLVRFITGVRPPDGDHKCR